MWQAYSAQILADQSMQIEFAQELRNISTETAMHQYEARDGALFVSRHLQDMTDQMIEIEQAFGVVLTMYEAYNHGYLRAAMIELVALAFVFFSVGLSLLIPKLWHCGKIVVFLYGQYFHILNAPHSLTSGQVGFKLLEHFSDTLISPVA